jgi:hypothetical protein
LQARGRVKTQIVERAAEKPGPPASRSGDSAYGDAIDYLVVGKGGTRILIKLLRCDHGNGHPTFREAKGQV